MASSEVESQSKIITVHELRQSGENFIPCDHQPLRYAPLEVISTAKSYLEKTGDLVQTAAYIVSAYEFFRGCVCWGESRLGVPLTFKHDAFEWLEPANFDWSDFDLISFYAGKAGTGFENFDLDKSEPFVVNNISQIGFIDSMTWQEDSAKLLLKPLRALRDMHFENDQIACYELERILAQLEEVSSDSFVLRYLGYRPRFG